MIVMTAAALTAFAGFASASAIGAAVSADASNDNFLSQTIAPDYTIGGDMFGIRSRVNGGSPGLPFAIADDSLAGFPTDSQGIIKSGDNGRFFGVVDTVNGTGNDTERAEWTFDVSGASALSVNIDFAAMGDFENSPFQDSYVFSYSFDGINFTDLFVSSVEDTIDDAIYFMEDGDGVLLNDPLFMNGVQLDNSFQTLSADIIGTGSTLTLRFDGGSDGGSEAFAFRNVEIVPTPGAIALAGIAGLAAARRRRA